MSDDGMLLNFSIGDGPLIQRQKLTGGSWRARRDVERLSRQRSRKKEGPKEGLKPADEHVKFDARSNVAEDVNTRPPKRQRVAIGRSVPRTKDQQLDQNHSNDFRGAEKQVISSLFRFNPSSTTKPETQANSKTDVEHIEPSNAPLSGELENFTSLGLSIPLATHLTQKLAIKKPTAIQKAAVTSLVTEDSDVFMQAETGSGKTLAYVLPMVQRIMDLSPVSDPMNVESAEERKGGVHRDSGLFAIILTPTRELSRQVSSVISSILPPYLVSGTVIGGEKKKSEKARLRKGLNILIATPGRLADHLEHTEALDTSRVRWLVLDEGDRLMELGFEEDIKKIVSRLDFRFGKGSKDAQEAIPNLPLKRITVLCSATMKMDVQRLGEISLKDARHVHADRADEREDEENDGLGDTNGENEPKEFTAPAQLKQSYIVVPGKLRLVTLMATLKQTFARKGAVHKVIAFISCADSVDFHFDVLTRPADTASPDAPDGEEGGLASPADDEETSKAPKTNNRHVKADPVWERQKLHLDSKWRLSNKSTHLDVSNIVTSAHSPYISPPGSSAPDQVTIYRLHGSLPPSLRTSTLKAFYSAITPAVLLCTDVASRGLDVPNVDLVIEFDPAFSRDDHLHRIGRTARAGKDGRACVYLMPGVEEGYVDILAKDRRGGASALGRSDADDMLKKAFSNTSATANRNKSDPKDWEEQATNVQLDIERWILSTPMMIEKARKGYQSHIRAYATHVSGERQYFDIKELHLGHLAKAFGLRDRPSMVNVPGMRPGAGSRDVRRPVRNADGGKLKGDGKRVKASGFDKEDMASGMVDVGEGARKMKAKVKGMMGGADEFNLG